MNRGQHESAHRRLFAMTYDRQMAKVEKVRSGRAPPDAAGCGATGDVLEIGAGTGANLAHYRPRCRVAHPHRARAPDVAPARAQGPRAVAAAPRSCAPRPRTCPFDDDTFDVVVSTLVLCGVERSAPGAARDRAGCCGPGAQLLFIEHVRCDDPRLARRQDRMNPVNRLLVCCECNRPTLASIEQAGFTVAAVEHLTLQKAPSFVSPLVVGRATVPAGAVAGPQ